MTAPAWESRFNESTRGRIVGLLRQGPRTVDELARSLELTDNAVRLQLSSLERDGLVRNVGVRREGTVGKPASLYEISPEAEPIFSRAYLPLLSTLLQALGERLDPRDLRGLMRDVGHRLAGEQPAPGDDVRGRVMLASGILNALGGVTSVEEDGEDLVIRGCGCPVGVAVAQRDEVCVALETMLTDVIGAPVREQCNRADRPQCSFHVRLARENGDGGRRK